MVEKIPEKGALLYRPQGKSAVFAFPEGNFPVNFTPPDCSRSHNFENNKSITLML